MLLLDEDQEFDKDLPKMRGARKHDQLLSEIAEEDDVSNVSESVKNPYLAGANSFAPGGKSSITSVKSVQSTSKISAHHAH